MAERLIEDPVLRQRYRLTREGDVLRLELWAEPGARAPAHFHPRLEERIEVQEGEFTFRLGREKKRLGPGERVVVEPGVRHSFANTGGGVARFTAEIEPALTMEEFFEGSAALARAGRFMRPGIPKGVRGLLEASEFAERHRETTVMAMPPPVLQPILLPPLARLARRRTRGAAR